MNLGLRERIKGMITISDVPQVGSYNATVQIQIVSRSMGRIMRAVQFCRSKLEF
jgi:hypothetical protein